LASCNKLPSWFLVFKIDENLAVCGIAKEHRASGKGHLLDELQVVHVRNLDRGLPATNGDWQEKELNLIYKSGMNCLSGNLRSADCDVCDRIRL
jgi:hypothetical protein